MTDACLAGDYPSAAALQCRLLPLIHALFCEVNPIPVKAAMNILGMEVGSLRLPLCDISSKGEETLRKAMLEIGLIK